MPRRTKKQLAEMQQLNKQAQQDVTLKLVAAAINHDIPELRGNTTVLAGLLEKQDGLETETASVNRER